MRRERERWHKTQVRLDPVPPMGELSPKEHSRIRGRSESLARIVSNKTSELKSKLLKKTRAGARADIESQRDTHQDDANVGGELFSAKDLVATDLFDPTISSKVRGLRRVVEIGEEIETKEQPDPDLEWSTEHAESVIREDSFEELFTKRSAQEYSPSDIDQND